MPIPSTSPSSHSLSQFHQGSTKAPLACRAPNPNTPPPPPPHKKNSELHSAMQGAPDGRYSGLLHSLNNGKRSVLNEPCRVTCKAHLVALSGIKETVSSVSVGFV